MIHCDSAPGKYKTTGMQDLLQSLSGNEIRGCSVADFCGMSIAIDASKWLSKAVYYSTEEVVDANFKDYMFYVDFLLARTRKFRVAGVEPVMVFNGKSNPLSPQSKLKREEVSEASLERGQRLLECMRSTEDSVCKAKLRNEAISCFKRGLKVTHEIERNAIAALRRVGVTVVVAPCEAGAQMAHLCQAGICQAALSEDPELLVYSAICGTPFPILYQFENSGMVQAVSLRTLNIHKQNEVSSPQNGMKDLVAHTGSGTELVSLFQQHFSGSANRRLLVQMCVLSGCEYADAMPGVGVREALDVCVKFKDLPDDVRLVRMVRYLEGLRSAGGRICRTRFLENALRAEAFFYYHPIYDPRTRQVKNFCDPRVISCFSDGDTNEGVKGSSLPPLIDNAELERIADCDELLSGAPAVVCVADVCEGLYSLVEFTPITPQLPWENPELRAPAYDSAALCKHPRNNVWAARSNLIHSLSPHIPHKNTHITEERRSTKVEPENMLSYSYSHSTARMCTRRIKRSSDCAGVLSPICDKRQCTRVVDENEVSTPLSSRDNKFSERENISPKFLVEGKPTSSQENGDGEVYCTPTLSANDSHHRDQHVEFMTPDYARLVMSGADSSPVKDVGSAPRISESPSGRNCAKRKSVDAVAVLANRVGKGKKQKTLMVASIKSYFVTS